MGGTKTNRKGNHCRLSFWRSIADRFPDERACLASFLAYHSAEVLNGLKPGNLINIANTIHPCRKNMFDLWHRHGDDLLKSSGLQFKIMAERKGGLLIYIYCPESLHKLLSEGRVRNFLRKARYRDYPDCERALAQLADRMHHVDFPHEIGLFLGYPLKDVAGFLGWTKLPLSAQGAWKIYGDPRRSLDLDACHHECRCRMVKRLHRVADPCRCLRKTFPSHEALSARIKAS